jgi:hypothetical protein
MNYDSLDVKGPTWNRKRRKLSRGDSPSVAEPRRPLLLAARSFVRAARACPGVQRISFLGSIVTGKAIPKDIDVLVTIDDARELTALARAGRRLMGCAQTINLGADIFLADTARHYLGRICDFRDCHPRALRQASTAGIRTISTTTSTS